MIGSLAAALFAVVPLLGGAAPSPGRASMAVLEMRAGSADLPEVGERLAKLAASATNYDVLGPAAARRLHADADAVVARCAGQPGCLAGLGRKLGVDAVLVVAVSRMGDVIVALQLVDVRAETVAGRVAEPLPRDAAPDEKTLGSWLEATLPPSAFRRWGTIAITTDVDGALVEIDGRSVGVSPLPPQRLPAPAQHQLRITHAGRKPFTMTLDLAPERTVQVMASLPEPQPPVWKRPWFWALAVGGLAAGTAVGISVATSSPSALDGHATVIRGGP